MKERTASFYIGEDQWHCTTYSVADIGMIESASSYLIRRAYDAWKKLSARDIPREGDFDPAKLLRSGEPGRVSRIDTTVALQRYKIHRIGPGEPIVTDLDLENPFHRHGVLMEVLECKETRRPIYQEVHVTIGGKETHKRRLLLPFADEDGNVVAVVTACCLITSRARQAIDIAANLR